MKKANNYENHLRITGPDRYNKHKYTRTIVGDIKVNKIEEKTARNMEVHNRPSGQKLYNVYNSTKDTKERKGDAYGDKLDDRTGLVFGLRNNNHNRI